MLRKLNLGSEVVILLFLASVANPGAENWCLLTVTQRDKCLKESSKSLFETLQHSFPQYTEFHRSV